MVRTPSQQRLIFEEFFLYQLSLALDRKTMRKENAIAFRVREEKVREALKRILPFKPTAAQKRVLAEIASDLEKTAPMNRLLQGDVGSGKTIVALEAAVIAIENGCQAALMAPTEILAVQHYLSARRVGSRWLPRRAAHQRPQARRENRRSRTHSLRRSATRHRHPRAHRRPSPIRAPRLRRHRRAASLRRPPTQTPHGQSRLTRPRAAATASPLGNWPPSRALGLGPRWLREARGSGGLPPVPAESRRREAAARSDAAFGPAPAATAQS